MNKSSPLLHLGRILRPRGLSGEVYLYLYVDPEDLSENFTVYIQLSSLLNRPLTVQRLLPYRGHIYRVQFHEIRDRAAAQVLSGQDIFIAPENLKRSPEDLYSYELVGMDVVDDKGRSQGRVREVYLYPSQDLLEVQYGEQVYLLPLVKAFVRLIDRENRRIVVQLPEGLLEP